MDDQIQSALRKVINSLKGIELTSIATLCEILSTAKTIGIYGCGREGYQMRGFAMRLFHLGCKVGYIGDTTMSPLGAGDVIIVSSGPGGLSTVQAHLETAQRAGASTVVITAQPSSTEAENADMTLTIPAQTMASDSHTNEHDILPMGSVFEAALFFLCEWIVADLKASLGETSISMRDRHTNME